MRIVLKPFSHDIETGKEIPYCLYKVFAINDEKIWIRNTNTNDEYVTNLNRILKEIKD